MNAISELAATLSDAWMDADLRGRLRAWWWVVRNPNLMDGPVPQVVLNDRQRTALQIARRSGTVTSRQVRLAHPWYCAETYRQDLAGLVVLGLLVKRGTTRGVYYVPSERDVR